MVQQIKIHRRKKKITTPAELGMTNVGALISLIKASVGTGCLEMPVAFCNAGYVMGFVGTYVVGLIMVYGVTILLQNVRILAKRHSDPQISYGQCLQLAIIDGPHYIRRLSPFAVFAVNFILVLYHFGVCCVYILFIADNLKQLGDEYFSNASFTLYVIGLTTPLVVIFLIRSIKNLVPLSMLANVLLITCLICILYFSIENLPPLSQREMFNSLTRFPLFFGTVMFSMESVGVILAIERGMKNPEDYLGFTGILTLGSLITLTVYAVFGFVGYWSFGCESYGNVTFNIPPHTKLAHLVKLFLAIAIYISYALQGYVVMDVLWNHYLIQRFDKDEQLIMELNTRCLIVLGSVFVAAISPDISIFLPFIGSFCLSILAFIFPCIIDLCMHYAEGYGPFKIILIRDVFLIFVGVSGSIAGTWVAWLDLLEEETHHGSLLFYYYVKP